MKTIGIRTVVSFLTAGLLATTLASVVLDAQEGSPLSKGSFTLPFETKWGKAILSPGDYFFTVSPGLGNSARVQIQGKKGNAFVLTGAIYNCTDCGSDALIVLRQDRNRSVQALRLASADMVLYYAPHTQVQEQMARDSKRIERVPVVASNR